VNTGESFLVATGFARRLHKAGLNVSNPMTNGTGTIVVTDLPVRPAGRGVPRGAVPGSKKDVAKPARDARVRISLALKGFNTDPNVQRYNELRGLFSDFERGIVRLIVRVGRKAGDAAADARLDVKRGRQALKVATAWLRQGDFDKTEASLRTALEAYDDAFQMLQRVVPAVQR
jgi:hypothetical protein